MNRKLCVTLLLCLVFSLTALATIIVDPSRFVLVGPPGTRLTQSINVMNTGDAPVNLTAVLYDWVLDNQGKLQELPAGTLEDSLGASLKFSPRQFKLEPGQTQVVRFTVEVPTDGIERKGIVFFEEELPIPGDQMGTTITTKIGATIYVAPEDATLAFEIIDVNVALIDGSVYFLVEAVNQGTAHIRFAIDYKLQTATGSVLLHDSYSEQVLLPGKTSKLYYPVAAVPSGDYRLSLVFKFTGFDVTHEQAIAFRVLGSGS